MFSFMIYPPFKSKSGMSGIWIEDSRGLTVADINPLLDSAEAVRIAELLANGTNSYLKRVAINREVGKKGGRPPGKKPRKKAGVR